MVVFAFLLDTEGPRFIERYMCNPPRPPRHRGWSRRGHLQSHMYFGASYFHSALITNLKEVSGPQGTQQLPLEYVMQLKFI